MSLLAILLIAAAPAGDIGVHGDLILAQQLEDGAIIYAQDGDNIAILPYHGNYAALGLFTAYRTTGEAKYLEGANRWTDWYLEHVDHTGFISNYAGTRDHYAATDSNGLSIPSAATFLKCASMRRMLTHDDHFVLRERGKLSAIYHHMMDEQDVDGLVPVSPVENIKVTLHNAEVYDALEYAKRLAHALRDYKWSEIIYYDRRKLDKGFQTLRDEYDMYAPMKTGTAAEGDAALVLDQFASASLAAAAIGPVGWHKAKATVREASTRYADLTEAPPSELYWWVMSARRVHRLDQAREALRVMDHRVTAHRPTSEHGMLILALASMEHKVVPGKFGNPMGSTFVEPIMPTLP